MNLRQIVNKSVARFKIPLIKARLRITERQYYELFNKIKEARQKEVYNLLKQLEKVQHLQRNLADLYHAVEYNLQKEKIVEKLEKTTEMIMFLYSSFDQAEA